VIQFEFSETAYNVNEGDGSAEVCIDLVSGVLSANTPIVITPQTGTAGGIKPHSFNAQLYPLQIALY
jgi:hypothetical protein